MYRFALVSLCLTTAAPAFAGDQSLYPHHHAATRIVGSYTTPINYRPHNPAGSNIGVGFVESEIVRSPGYNAADTKALPRTNSGAGSIADDGPVTEIFVENLPALNGTYAPRHVMIGSNLPRN
ncbi:hypothetical protein [Litoreibacter albidus]|uniref:Uncharacterized protein n=1 Tax=Litoreibacter albidus TaxID=670155 RepID=A0A1H2RIC6_9RHOB|nr:hypothetical protein [Litoreibacter albidus]SDW18379.1 hypothetical protein SAMN04488001_0493 [Litoreibacter albidus]